MRVNKIELQDFRAAKSLSIDLLPRMNLVIGVNGAGKSTVLQAISISLLALVHRIQNTTGNRKLIQVSDISNAADYSSLEISVRSDEKDYSWKIIRSRPGVNTQEKGDEADLVRLSRILKNKYKTAESLPVIAYYPVGRVVERVVNSMTSRLSEQQESMDVYDNALEGRPNFHNFFRWFREQDDFVNQKSLSRSHWIKKNSSKLRWQISQLFDEMDKFARGRGVSVSDLREWRLRDFDFIIHEPRFIFREIIEMIYRLDIKDTRSTRFTDVLHELDYMLHRMDMLSSEGQDSAIYSQDNLLEILSRVLSLILPISVEHRRDEEVLDIIWSMFVLSFELGLWWLSNESHNRLIHVLTEMYRLNRKNKPEVLKYEIIEVVREIIFSDIRKRSSAQINFGRDIQNVARAIEKFVPEYSNLRINRTERGSAQMLVDKDKREFDIGQLSDGERNLIALVGDIARRLTIGNPNSEDPLKEPGIIMIDELDLHLHPKWQRIVAMKITEVFPNCQFIVSSHSPQVISHVQSDSIVALKSVDGEITKHFVGNSYGKNSDRILEDVMDETARPKDIDERIRNIFGVIQDGEISRAQDLISELRAIIGEDSDLIKAGVLIKRREIIGR